MVYLVLFIKFTHLEPNSHFILSQSYFGTFQTLKIFPDPKFWILKVPQCT